MTIKNIRHTGIVVDDLQSSLSFYQDVLGFSLHKKMDEQGSYINNMLALENVNVTTVKLTSPDGQMIELLHFKSHPRELQHRETPAIGISHVAFTVDDLEKTFKELTSKGIEFNAEPQYSPDGYAKVTFCRAPEGTLIELVEVLS